MLHLNIHFLYPKLDEIKLLNFDKQLDVLCFCETFLNDSFSDHELSINNYNMFRRDRGTIGGGLVIYVKYIYHCTRISDLESISLECICLEIKSNTLCWDAHIEQLIKKCNSYLFLLSRIKVFLSRRNRILFFDFQTNTL